MTNIAMSLDGISKRYADLLVLSGVAFSCGRGESVAIVGRNGAGKSTLLGIIAGTIRPESGAVALSGESEPASQRVAIAFQSPCLFLEDTVKECFGFYSRLQEARNSRNEELSRLISLFKLGPLLNSKLKELSGGELQKVNLILALTKDAKVLLFDEPTSSLDAESQVAFWIEVERRKAGGTVVLFVTHSEEELRLHSDSLVLLDKGTVAKRGAYDEILGASGFAAAYRFAFDDVRSVDFFIGSYSVPDDCVLLRSGELSLDLFLPASSGTLKEFGADIMSLVKDIRVDRFGIFDSLNLPELGGAS